MNSRRFAATVFLISLIAASVSTVVSVQGVLQPQAEAANQQSRTERILLGIASPFVALLGAAMSYYYFRENTRLGKETAVRTAKLSQELADRTVNVESQKLLLEINKQYLQDPKLFSIYTDWPNRDELLKDPALNDKIKALGYLKLNVFEIVFAVLPQGDSHGVWKAYFEDSLKRCPVLLEELIANRNIYHPNLIAAFDRWNVANHAPS